MNQKTKKKTVTKKPKESEGIVLRIRETRVQGNEYEDKILKVCSKNRYPFAFKDSKVKGKVPDFINRERKRIIEVYNPERSLEEVQARMSVFYIHGYKTIYLTKDNLSRPDWEKYCTGAIRGFLA